MINPANYAKAGTEHAHQTALFIWASAPELRQRFPALALMFAIPNGGVRDGITAARLKAEGVKAGVPDVFLPVARHKCHGLFIELKRPKSETKRKGSAAAGQSEWIDKLREQGYGACICYGYQAASEVILQYLKD